jgi:hypothetical protein
LIVAIATRHADAVEINFLGGHPVWIALPHPIWAEYNKCAGVPSMIRLPFRLLVVA